MLAKKVEEDSLQCSIKRRKMVKYGRWKTRLQSLVLCVIEEELPGKNEEAEDKLSG